LCFGKQCRELQRYFVSSEVTKGQGKCPGSRVLRATHLEQAEVQRAAFLAQVFLRESYVIAARFPAPVWLY